MAFVNKSKRETQVHDQLSPQSTAGPELGPGSYDKDDKNALESPTKRRQLLAPFNTNQDRETNNVPSPQSVKLGM